MISINKINIYKSTQYSPGEGRVTVSYDITDDVNYSDIRKAINLSLEHLNKTYTTIHFPKGEITLDDVEDIVCRIMNVDPYTLKINSRKREILVPRQIAQAMAKEYTKHTLSVIGRRFGNKDHATVLSSTKVVRDVWSVDRKYGYAGMVKAIRDELELLAEIVAKNKKNEKNRSLR